MVADALDFNFALALFGKSGRNVANGFFDKFGEGYISIHFVAFIDEFLDSSLDFSYITLV